MMTEIEESENLNANKPSIRTNLVHTAVTFLMNPEVINRPDFKKIAFLKKKGLTDEEITEAFKQAQNDPDYINNNVKGSVVENRLVPPPLPYVPSKPSLFMRISNLSSSLIILGVALYGLHRFYVLYIEPWLFGKTSPQNKLNQMEQQFSEMNHSLSDLKKTVSALEETINQQKIQLERYLQNEVNEYMPTPMALKDLKAEVGCVKSLLLNRHQFPAVPKVSSPSIPVWQLASLENGETKTEVSTNETQAENNKAEIEVSPSLENSKLLNGTSLNDNDSHSGPQVMSESLVAEERT
ncbi:peroxisomal membrane protein PEX14-like [Uloborus diversus]|uniref:peroxisomal membrane protein PEX14-like n=1 Tax=Uloborus diversus TaxID=327109 RepID=UPI00240A95CE|nr:peroxisomal membrane protein PEX14-like [Uloborus diversus]